MIHTNDPFRLEAIDFTSGHRLVSCDYCTPLHVVVKQSDSYYILC